MKDFEKLIANQLRGLKTMLQVYADELDAADEKANSAKVIKLDDARRKIKEALQILDNI